MRRGSLIVIIIAGLALSRVGVVRAQDVTFQGGEATTDDASTRAYDQGLPNITDAAAQLLQDLGQTGFLRDFGRVKIGGKIRLGPQFNARSCAQCHGGNGRGTGRISARGPFSDTVVKMSMATGRAGAHGGPIPVPHIGTQLPDHSVKPSVPKGRASLRWRIVEGQYPDGTRYALRSPRLQVTVTDGKLPAGVRLSVRRAPPVFGSGLLEAISEDEIQALADPGDANGDGISGRPNVVWDVSQRRSALGRFGFKAGNPTLRQQIAAAYAVDMGVTNPLFRMSDPRPDISSRILDATTFYTATRAVPKARDQEGPSVLAGKANFTSMGCAACHQMEMHTSNVAIAALSNQTIHPFTDLLLHDMGPELADNRSEYEASGSEWRTTPLWGIGLTGVVLNGRAEGYLHDGRARSLEEAILWHGGEAEAAKQRFMSAAAQEREHLITFLRSL